MRVLRPAVPDDEARLLAWRNEPTTRSASFTSGMIDAAEHHAWFTAKLADPGCVLFIVEVDQEAVGQVRIDRISPAVGVVSVGLVPEVRGRGIGRWSLSTALDAARDELGVAVVRAHVKIDNVASLRAFEAAGFREVGREIDGVVLERSVGVPAG